MHGQPHIRRNMLITVTKGAQLGYFTFVLNILTEEKMQSLELCTK